VSLDLLFSTAFPRFFPQAAAIIVVVSRMSVCARGVGDAHTRTHTRAYSPFVRNLWPQTFVTCRRLPAVRIWPCTFVTVRNHHVRNHLLVTTTKVTCRVVTHTFVTSFVVTLPLMLMLLPMLSSVPPLRYPQLDIVKPLPTCAGACDCGLGHVPIHNK
jgi:hypothetical protein